MTAYTKLGDDLDAVIRSFETNPAVTDRQKEIWRREGGRRAITHGMFGYDHEKSLAYEDGTKVGSLKQNSARRFWDYAEGHVFPPIEDVVRFCLFMHLDIYRTLALVLKAEWERFFARDINGWRAANGVNLTDILFDADEHARRKALAEFMPGSRDLHTLLAEEALRHARSFTPPRPGNAFFLEGHTSSTFSALVDEMLMGRLHFFPVDGPELSHFRARARKEFILLVDGTEEQQRIYPLEKARWVSLRGELEDLYLLIENRRLKNAQTQRLWLTVFGPEEIALMEAAQDYERGDIRFNLKAANPDWNRGQIERRVEEEETARLLQMSRLKTDAALAPRLVREPGPQDDDGTAVETGRYLKECKTVLRRIRRLLHPDKLIHHPSFKNLTVVQKERLQAMLLSALEIRHEELGYPEGTLLHEMRSLEGLKNALSRVEAILGHPGIDTDERIAIQGETLPEKLEWLRKEMRLLEDEILGAKAELQALFEDEDATKKQAILDDPAAHEKVKDDFRTRTAQLRRDAERLREDFNRLFQ